MERNHASKIKKELASLTNGLIDTLTDAVLYFTFNALTGFGIRTMSQGDYAMYQADILLSQYNSQTIRKALDNLVSRHYVSRKKTKTGIELAITQNGIKRLNEFIPTYKEKRPWDGYLYLVSYDIPIKSNAKRNLLREYLRRIGCGKLQDSLWMTPYNPTGIVDDFVDTYHIPGMVLVSKLGKDGSIGDEDRKSLIYRIYSYKKLNTRYQTFIDTYRGLKNPQKTQLSIEYYTILREDPQLPFVLEPEKFGAREANKLFLSAFTR